MNKTTPKPAFRRFLWIFWGGLIVLLLFLGSAFAHAWQMNLGLQAEVATLAPMLTAALAQQSTLEARLDYVQSDEYIAEWAREHAGMTLPGETLVIPITPTPTPTPIPTPTPPPTPTPIPPPFWMRWWQALRGE